MSVIARLREVGVVQCQGRNALSRRTVETYEFWTRKFYTDCGKKPAAQWTGEDVSRWMHKLAVDGYAGKTRSQALCAIVYVFKHVLQLEPGQLCLPQAPREAKRLKVIPTPEEVRAIFAQLHGQSKMLAGIMYGAGLRVEEACMLRVQDFDFARLTIRIHSGKGDKDRMTLLPRLLVEPLQKWLVWRAALHERDLASGAGYVELPGRLAMKYRSAPRELRWQYVFPSAAIREGYRWHAVPEGVQKAMRGAVARAGITTRVTPHTLRHAFATHSMQSGNSVDTIRQCLGHENLETTLIYLHDRATGTSPLDCPPPNVLIFTAPPQARIA